AAIDVKTGKIRWVRGYIGEFLFVPDPTGSNDLWALASTCQRLDAATGRTMQTVPIPAQAKKDERRGDRPWRMVHGLRVKGQVSWGANRFGRDVQDPVQVFDIDNKEIVSVKAINLRTENKLDQIDLDVDQSPQLVQTHVQMRPIGGGNAKWKFTTAGYSGNRPMLFGRDVVVLSGMPDTVGAVTRLDPDSGAPRWTTRLPRGAYVIGQRQLRDGWYGYETWSAIGQLNNQYLFAIGGDGEVFVLDAETGRIVGSSRHVSLHLAPPRLVGDQLVMIGDTRAVSVSFAAVLGKVVPQAVSDRATASARATENRQPAEAVRLAEEAISRWPGNADAWMALSNATRAAGNDTAAVRAACRALELSRQPTTDWLRDRFGLIARIDTGPLRAPVALMGLFLYAPSTNGLLYVIDPETRKVVEERPMQGDASSAIWQDQQLIRQGNDRRREIIATTPDTAERPLREDPLYPHVEVTVASGASRRVKQRTLPQEWTRVGGGIGGEIKIDGRTIRTVTGGGTRELIGEEMTVHEPVMLGVKEWFFVQTAAGPLGCGVGGVY
ncbi:MAG TPA: PQQ-binding-like beta-propeller repeat protein, partial [Tepidisphaeraceae bacterium]